MTKYNFNMIFLFYNTKNETSQLSLAIFVSHHVLLIQFYGGNCPTFHKKPVLVDCK